MSLFERIAEMNRLNNLLQIKHDKYSKAANKPDQRVRKIMSKEPPKKEVAKDSRKKRPTKKDATKGKKHPWFFGELVYDSQKK